MTSTANQRSLPYLDALPARQYLAECCAIPMACCLHAVRELLQGPSPDCEAALRECFEAFFDLLLPLVCQWRGICPCAAPTGLNSAQVFREYRRLSRQNDGVSEEDRQGERALLGLATHLLLAEALLRRGRLADADSMLYLFERSPAYRLLLGDDAEWTDVPPPPHFVAAEAANLVRSLQL